MAKKKPDPKTEPKPSKTPTTVIGAKRLKKHYSLSDNYLAWKEHCDNLKSKSSYHSSEATRYRNGYKKAYENGAAGFCQSRDDKEWDKANNLITMAELKADKRANAWKDLPLEKLDIPVKLIGVIKSAKFETLGSLADWANKEHRDKKKGLGVKAVDKIRDALNAVIAPYHQPIIQADLEQAKEILNSLSK